MGISFITLVGNFITLVRIITVVGNFITLVGIITSRKVYYACGFDMVHYYSELTVLQKKIGIDQSFQ